MFFPLYFVAIGKLADSDKKKQKKHNPPLFLTPLPPNHFCTVPMVYFPSSLLSDSTDNDLISLLLFGI